MARYKEQWEDINSPEVVGYIDTDHAMGRFLPINSAEVADWIADGNTPDPAFTAEEIAAAEVAAEVAAADAYLATTAPLVQRYRDEVDAGRRPFIPETKFNNLLKKRARAQKLTSKIFNDF